VRLPSPARNTARAALAGALIASAAATALPLSLDEIAGLCSSGPGPENCARRIEAVQLTRLPDLAKRDGATLIVSLYPAGTTSFADADVRGGLRTYSLYDYVSEINAVVLYVTEGAQSSFVLLQRAGGRRTDLPADPYLSPDRQSLATADFCAERCTNEIALWRITRDGVHKTHAFRPREQWTDAVATWKDAGTLAIEYTPAGQQMARVMDARISDADWIRFPAP
jgi:hypothetical protein